MIISVKRKTVLIFVLIAFLSTGIFTELFSNSWFVITGRGYFIPAESNILSFRPTKWNEGSGEWWLYGEDTKYYYGLNTDEGAAKYYKIPKTDTGENFSKYDYTSWKK